MNRKRLTAVIVSAGLVIGGTSIHHSSSNNKLLLTKHTSKVQGSRTTQNESNREKTSSLTPQQTKKTTAANVNKALALNANTNIQIAYIGGGNNSQTNSSTQNSYSFAAVDPNNNNSNTELNTNVAPQTISDAPLTFASPLQKRLYEYLSVPANQALTMQTAINLHDGDPLDTCVFFQSSALRANGFNIPLSTSYTTELMGNLLESGWQRHTDFNNLQPGDICFASTYHTFMFMGWYNKAEKIAYVMGNESYSDSANYRDRHINGQTAAASNGYNEQYRATCYYTYNGQPSKHLILSGEIIGGATNVMSQSGGNGSVVGQVYYGDNVAILEQQGHYYKIDKNGLIGWVYAVDILPNGILPNYTNPNNNNNNINTGNNSNASNINTSNKGETIQVTSSIGLWLLNSPSIDGSKITVMPYNTEVTVLGQIGNWTKVNYNGTIGWCYSQYTNAINTSSPSPKPTTPKVAPAPTTKPVIGTTTITSPIGLWQLSAPSLQGTNITVIPYNTKVNVYGEKNGWYEIEYNGVKGWSYAQYTSGLNNTTNTNSSTSTQNSNSAQATATVNSNIGLWLLDQPSMQGNNISVMPYNTKLTVLGQSGNWTKVDYNGTIGWCYSQYITQSGSQNTSPAENQPATTNSAIGTTTITSGIGLWQLSSPSMQGGHITVIPYNTTVKVFAEQNGWYEVEYNGVKGWSYAQYTSGLTSNPVSNTKMKQVISPVGLWLLQSPYLSAGKIEIMPYKANLQVLAQNGNWTKVNYNGTEGWCYTQYTKNI
ncbi:MAG: SH3 domain-containing protein [Sarcina sp.]